MADESTDERLWTIEELASGTDMTVRNVRAHQSRGLLPPPVVRGRVGYYGPEHRERLLKIREMQEEGFNLSAIRSLLAAGDETAERLRRLQAGALAELQVGPRAELDPDMVDLIAFESEISLDALVAAGVLRALPEGGYAAASPALLLAGRRLRGLGIEPKRQLAATASLVALCQQAAEGLAQTAAELCGEDCTDKAVLAEARAYITEIVRAVIDRSLTERLAARYS